MLHALSPCFVRHATVFVGRIKGRLTPLRVAHKKGVVVIRMRGRCNTCTISGPCISTVHSVIGDTKFARIPLFRYS